MAQISGTQGYWKIDLYVNETSTSVENNTSTASWELWIGRTYASDYPMYGTPTINISISGKSAYSGSPYFALPSVTQNGVKLLSGTVSDIAHNSDGTIVSNAVSFSWTGSGFSPNSVYGSGTYSTATIPRATPAPNISCDVESSVPFTLSPYADFYQSVQIKFGDYESYLLPSGKTSGFESKQPKSVTEWTFSADKDYYRRFDKKSLIGSLIVRTYRKSILHQSYTLIGTSTGQITINANANLCSPVITGTVVDTLDKTELGLTENDLIKYVSKLELTATIQITAPNDNNATLSFLQVAGKTISDLTTRVFPIENPLNKSFLVKAINSRDFSTETVISASGEFIDYILPTVTITSAKRTEPTTGDATIEYKGDWFNNKFSENVSNTLTLTWKYKEKGQTAYTSGGTLTPTVKDNTFSGTINVDGLFNYLKQYDVIIVAKDKLTSVDSAVVNIPRGFPIFWWSENFVDILGELRINGNNPFLYSEDETVIGKWYDGKTLYRKVLNIGNYTWDTGRHEFIHGIDNLDTAVDLKITGYLPTYTRWYVNWDNLINNNWTVDGEKIYIQCTSSGNDFTRVALILEYTKTTNTLQLTTNDKTTETI